jgi:DNA invertase Pin-like site-specific DNA recombinase
VQGVIAEYERTRILERSRRGQRHAARSGCFDARRRGRAALALRPNKMVCPGRLRSSVA